MADSDPVNEAFYDGLAADYHLVYGGDWDVAVHRQGQSLDRLLRHELADRPLDILDCSCGIGTQAIGLALHGHHVAGSDLSAAAIARARAEAARFEIDVEFQVADFRDLSALPGPFDAVVSLDNALPHLDSDAEVLAALKEMRGQLRPEGLLALSVRDYERALQERSTLGPTQLIAGPPRQVLVRLHDWDGLDSDRYTVRFLVLEETPAGWALREHHGRYRALRRQTLLDLAAAAGLRELRWFAESSHWPQPLLLARR